MKLVILSALLAVCSSAKLDRTYLPPASANTAGGTPELLQTPLTKANQEQVSQSNNPIGSYTNDFQGVVVDAAIPGVRASESELSGLGAPRPSYGSTDSKVGEAAFRGSANQGGLANQGLGSHANHEGFGNHGLGGSANQQLLGHGNQGLGGLVNHGGHANQGFGGSGNHGDHANQRFGGSGNNGLGGSANQGFSNQAGIGEVRPERPQSFKDRNSNILTYSNDVDHEAYSYGFETDNGIAVGENGVAVNGVQAQGGYSYMGDDGKEYKVTYVADEGGYRPQGDHLPTPHPIPEEILKSLEQNAKEEAAGVVDDGSYDAQKYNSEGDYTANNGGNIHNGAQLSSFGNRPADASASGSFINQNNQPFGKPGSHQSNNNDANQFSSGFSSQHQAGLTSQVSQNQGNQYGLQNNGQHGHYSQGQMSQFTQSQNNFDKQGPQFGVLSQNNQASGAQFGNQPQFGFGVNSLAGKPVKPSFGQNAVVSGSNQFGNQVSKPQGPDAGFGKPSQFVQQSQFSQSNYQFNSQGQGQFNKPLNQLQPGQNQFNKFGSTSSNNVPQASNQYESNNEYLPPKNDLESKPQINGVANNFNSANPGLNNNRPSQNFNQAQGFQNSAAISSLASQLGPQSEAKPDNFPSQSQAVPNKFSQNFNSQYFGQSQFNSVSTPSKPFGSSNLKPTSIPDTELTTPLEPNEISSKPQFDGQTTVSFGSFNQQSNQFGQSQFNSQNNVGSQERPISPVSVSLPLPGKPSSGSQLGIRPQNIQGPQFSQNSFNQNQFAQSNDAYYYKQPSKPFGTPQVSRFPSTPSYQSNVGFNQNSQFNNQQVSSSKVPGTPLSLAPLSSTTTSQFGQSQSSLSNLNGITQAAISPFPSVSPTTSTQFNKPQNSQFGSSAITQNSFNQQQLSVSSPTSSVPSRPQFSQQNNAQTQRTQPTTVTQTDASSQSAVQNQQYSGTIYEYNKPAQTLPSTQPDSDSSQSIQSNTASPKPLQDEQVKEPSDQIDSKPQSSFQTSQFSQNAFTQTQQVQRPQKPSQNNLRPQVGSQISGNVPSLFDQNTQTFSSQISSQQQFSQPKPSSFPSTQSNFGQTQFQESLGVSQQPTRAPQTNFDAAVTGYPSHEESRPHGPAFPTNSQFTTPIRQPALGLNLEPEPLPNKGFGQLKPQSSQDQFSQNTQFTAAASQPIQTQFGSNSYNQQTTFGQNGPSAIRPSCTKCGQSLAQALVSQDKLTKPFQPTNKPINQFNQNQHNFNQFGQNQQISTDSQGSGSSQISDEPIKPEQPSQSSQFGNQFSGFQSSQTSGFSTKGEEFEGPRQPSSFDDKTGYHY